MIKLGYHNDGKEKFYSHVITMLGDDFSYNPFNICGQGETKEEALKDFMKQFSCLMEDLNAFETMLYDSNVITDNIVNVDCFGKEIE